MKNKFDITTKENVRIENKYVHTYNHLEDPLIFNDIILYQLGEIYLNNSAVVDPHTHLDYFEVSYIISGTGMFVSNGKKQMVKKGDLFLSLPEEVHEIISDTYDPLRYYYVAVSFKDGTYMKDILYTKQLLGLDPINRIHHTKNFDFFNKFSDLIGAFESNSDYSEYKFSLLLKAFIIDVVEIFENVEIDKPYSPLELSNTDSIYYEITKYIDKNLLTMTNLKDVSNALNHNYSYLSRIFKNKFGQTMFEYYSIQKLNYAKKLIEEGNMSITKISNYLNYTSVYVFSRSFKNAFGVSPKVYKDNLSKTQKS